MIKLVTDLKDKGWLLYILEEFVRIEGAEFQFVFEDLEDYSPGSKENGNTLFYVKNPIDGFSIPNKNQQTTLVDLQKISDDIYVFKNTLNNLGFTIPYDLLWNAFCFLSRKEEYEQEEAGKSINSYSFSHPRKEKLSFQIPVVNHLFTAFRIEIQKAFPQIKFQVGNKPKVELSHDLDYITKTPQLRLKQTAFNLINFVKSLGQPKSALMFLGKAFRFLFSNPSYWCFDYWEKVETKYGFTSVFYVYAKTSPTSFKKWLFDPSYDIAQNTRLQKKLKELSSKGFSIGIHGSFNSAEEPNTLAIQKEILERTLQLKIRKGRQHWLRYSEKITPGIHENLLEEDSTIGWNDMSGFRAGICNKYRAYSHEEKRPLELWIVPQLIMDSHLFDYAANAQDAKYEEGAQLIRSLKNYKNAYVSISWHPRTCSSDYNWHLAYEKYLKEIHQL